MESSDSTLDEALEPAVADSVTGLLPESMTTESHHSHLTWALAFTAGVFFVTLILTFTDMLSSQLRADARIFLPVLQLIGPIVIWRTCGTPRSAFRGGLVVSLYFGLAVNLWYVHVGEHQQIIALASMVALRLFIAGAWTFVVATMCIVMAAMMKGRASKRTWVRNLMKLGFACTLVIVPLECAARLIKGAKRLGHELPVNLPASADIHIATIGGSTMLGFPYAPHYGIGKVATWDLRQSYSERSVELINLAVTGVNLELAMRELHSLTVKPDVLIVYSGHNEFFHNLNELASAKRSHFGRMDDVLAYSPLFRTLNSVASQYLLVSPIGDDRYALIGDELCPAYVAERRLNRYAAQLRELFDWARQQGISVVYCVPAASEADSEPNVSALQNNDQPSRTFVQTTWQEIRRRQQSEDWDDAASLCENALALHPGFAEFHFRLAECLQQLDRHEEAQVHFQLALERDQFPMRCRATYREAGLREAMARHIPTIDASGVLRQHSSSGYLDESLFLDGVHPNLKATYLLGRAVAETIMRERMIASDQLPESTTHRGFADSLADLGFRVEHLAEACETTADVLAVYAEFRSFDSTRRDAESAAFLRLAEGLRSGDVQSGDTGVESLTADIVYQGLP